MTSAIFTIVRNEKVYLPIWLNYYSKYFDNIHVIDHASDDGSTTGINAHVIKFDNDVCYNHAWLLSVVKSYQRHLLKDHDVVAFAEVDEMLWCAGGLRSYVENMTADCVRARGYDLIQMQDENEIDLTRPVLSQRKYWHANPMYDKTLISKIALDWQQGFHTAQPEAAYDDNLFLVHLKKMDYKMLYARNEERIKWNWSQLDVEKEYGWQSRVLGEEFNKFYYQDNVELIRADIVKSEVF